MLTTLAIGYSVTLVLVGVAIPCLLGFVAWAMGGFED